MRRLWARLMITASWHNHYGDRCRASIGGYHCQRSNQSHRVHYNITDATYVRWNWGDESA